MHQTCIPRGHQGNIPIKTINKREDVKQKKKKNEADNLEQKIRHEKKSIFNKNVKARWLDLKILGVNLFMCLKGILCVCVFYICIRI